MSAFRKSSGKESDIQAVRSTARRPRIAIFIVTYNAVGTLRQVLDRIPEEVWEKVEEVFVHDDHSADDTYLIGLGYKALHGRAKLTIFRNERNLGYGGNQIRGYEYAIKKGYDIVVLLHGDGQYAPEVLPDLLEPLESGEADAVFGSRMIERGAARAGGMPLYKYVGNRVLSTFENAMLGTAMSEFHSGYRLYSCHALKKLPFQQNTHDFHFDSQIIVQMHAAGMRIVERPIPTYYGDEICHVNGMVYAKNVVKSIIEFRLHELGVLHREEYAGIPARYSVKRGAMSSHSQLLRMVGPPPLRVLDVGCGIGELAHTLREHGHHVVGVDRHEPQQDLGPFIKWDLQLGLPTEALGRYDLVLLADVLEHLTDPEETLRQLQSHLLPGGRVLVSLPNVVHWSVRANVLRGSFDYTTKGILDQTHLRFFTGASAAQLFERCGYEIVERRTTPVPWERAIPAEAMSSLVRVFERLDHTLSRLMPGIFAYQNLFELRLRPQA